MNAKTALGMAVTTGLIVALTGTPEAMAGTISNHSGTICKNYDGGQANYMDYYAYGARSTKSGTTYVICPLVRSTTRAYGAYAYVDIKHSAGARTSCTLYSYGWNGNLLGSNSQTWTGSGVHEFSLYLGSGKSNTWSDYAVLCTIPGPYTGLIMGIDLSEN